MSGLPAVWSHVHKDYEITESLGAGSFGQVIEAKKRATG